MYPPENIAIVPDFPSNPPGFNPWRAASLETFFTGAHVDPSFVYELPLLGGANFPLKARPPNRTFGYISAPECSPAYNWSGRMVRMQEERRKKELRQKKARDEEELKAKGKGGKKGEKGAQTGEQKGSGKASSSSNQPTHLGPHSIAQENRGRSQQRSHKRDTSADRARKVHRSLSAFAKLSGAL